MATGHTGGTDRSPIERANELLGRMTLTEKTRQLTSVMPIALLGPRGLNEKAAATHLGHGIGHISNAALGGSDPVQIAGMVRSVQQYLREHTRLGIPAIVHAEALNGLVAPGYTSFPTAIALAATWDPESVRAMTEIVRQQMRSIGVLQALSPVLDIARDPRWGRVHETYGEDVYLTSAMAVAFVRGLQGDDLSEGVLATAKHFLGYGVTEAGQNMAATHFGRRELYDVYAAPFEAAIKLAGLGSVMNSYSEVDGVPAGASRELLTDLLRGRMGFDGSVVSDYNTIEWLHARQSAAESVVEAGRLALEAGLDVELPWAAGYGDPLEAAVREGQLSEDVVDVAVRRVLVDKFRLGLFENPFPAEEAIILSEAGRGRELSGDLARKAITLLRNEGVLPLAPTATIAVVGPNAESALVNFGAYTFPAMVDMMKRMASGQAQSGMEEMLGGDPESAAGMQAAMAQLMAVDTEAVAEHAYGALPLVDAIRAAAPGAKVESVVGVGIQPDEPQDLDAAVAAAQRADVVVLALGGRAGWFGGHANEGEGTDVARIELPPHQVALVRAVAATGTPLVAVLHQGRAYALTEIEELLDGVLVAWFPGPEGPAAVASVLFGDTNPSGKLPYTIPRATGQIPVHVGQKRGSGQRRADADLLRSYHDLPLDPLYPFGHGLSYTTFAYDDLVLDAQAVPAEGGTLTVSATVRNTGDRSGTETVQFYASDTAPGVTRPELALIGFTRVDLEPGEVATVRCTVTTAQLGYSGVDGRFVLDPGPVDVSVGASSADLRLTGRVEVTGPRADLEGRRAFLSESVVTGRRAG